MGTNMGKDIVDIAIGEIGYTEKKGNKTKYGKWYGLDGAAWCHMFLSWCASQAGISTDIFPKTASTDEGMAWFQNRGLFQYKGQYIPKRGDVIYFKSNKASHVGLVEKVSGSAVHTVEGNSYNQVVRRSHPLNEDRITGYGIPKYTQSYNVGGSGSTGAGASVGNGGSGSELEYLRRFLKKKKPESEKITGVLLETKELAEEDMLFFVHQGKVTYQVPVLEDMKVVWERKGVPGKLTFEAVYQPDFTIFEGDKVTVSLGGTTFFQGFVFSRNFSKDKVASYTAYDQLRYLKAKETLVYKNKTASQIIDILAKRFGLACGKLADTKYKMSAVEDDTEVFEIIQNALDNTMMVKNKCYVFYDQGGLLTLTDVADRKVNSCVIDGETGEDYVYKTSIDNGVYNQIKLIYKNEQEGTLDLYMVRCPESIERWGLLQYLEKINSPDIGKLKAEAYLKIYNQKQRTLSISGVIGNKNVRAGSLVPVMLDLSEAKLYNYMLVEKATHIFQNKRHTMDLVLAGGGFGA